MQRTGNNTRAAVSKSKGQRRGQTALIEPLEGRQLLSATFTIAPLPSNLAGLSLQVFNDAGQIAGYNQLTGSGFLYSGGKTTYFHPPSGDTISVDAINASGQLAGTVQNAGNPVQAFIYSGGKLTLLGALGGMWSTSAAITNSGVVAGEYDTAANNLRGFVYSGGKMTDLGSLGGAWTFVSAMNNAGAIVGYSELANNSYDAFMYSGGKMTDIDPGGSRANGINDAGQIVGVDGAALDDAAFIYSGGKITHLELTPGGASAATVINASGEIAGTAVTAKGQTDLFTYLNGVIKDQGPVPNLQYGLQVSQINNAGEFIGSYDATGSIPDNFLFENGAIQSVNYDLSVEPPMDYGYGPEYLTLNSYDHLLNNGTLVADDGENTYILTPANPASISGTAFDDVNNDGVQQSSEKGLSGLQVYDDIYDTGSYSPGDPTTTTNSAGKYTLSDLAPGPYIIRFVPTTTNWRQSVRTLTLSSGQNVNVNFATLPLYDFAVTDLGTLGGATSTATAINNVGQIVGEADTPTAKDHPFLYTIATGKFTDLSSLLGANAVINGINDLGQIVGVIPNGKTDSAGNPATQGFVYSSGKFTLLSLPSGTEDGSAIGINDKGQIIATANTPPLPGPYGMSYTNAYLYSASTGKLVADVPQEFEDIGAVAINNNGQIFEDSYDPAFKSEGANGIFLYTGGKIVTLPSTTSAPGPWFGDPVDVSLANTVEFDGDPHNPPTLSQSPAFFYSGIQAVDLNEAVPANKWNLETAAAINSSNMIVGQGTDPQGKTHAYLLTPVLASISGTVFDDYNGDGAKQAAEPGLAGWTVYADLKGDGKLDPGDPMATTTATGGYSITGLPAGGFTIRIVPKTGYHGTAPTVFSQTIVAPGQGAAGPSFGEVLTGPYSGKPAPFTTIQAENFDLGGQGTGYYDPGNINRGGLYRPLEGVGVGAIPSADGGGYFVGYTQTGEYLNYTVSVAATGTYTLNFRVASTPAGGKFHLNVDGTNVTGSLGIPNTGNFNTYQIVARTGVHLTAGTHVLQLVIDSESSSYGAAGNFDWIQAVKTA